MPETPYSEAPDDGASTRRGLLKSLASKLVLSLLIGGAFVWLVREKGGLPMSPPPEAWERLSSWAIPAYLGLLLFSHFLRATRWRYLIAPVKTLPLREVVVLNWIGFFAIFAFPLRMGELARPALTKLRQQIPVSVGIGTVAVERVVDGLVTSLCVAWALFALPRVESDDHFVNGLPFYGYLALTVFSCAFIALGVFLWNRKVAQRWTEAVIGLVSPKLARVLATKVSDVADGVRSLGDVRLTAGFLAETLGYWGSNAAGVWILAIGCGLPLDFGHAVAVMGILAIGILLPTGPGLFGNFQFAVLLALKLYFSVELLGAEAALFVFLLYVCQSGVTLVTGVVPLLALRIPMGSLLRVGTPTMAPPAAAPPENL